MTFILLKMSEEITDRVRTLGTTSVIEPTQEIVETNRETQSSTGIRDDNLEGVLFEEQTSMTNVVGRPVSYIGNLEEREWNMKNFFLIPVRIASGAWKTTWAAGEPVAEFKNELLWKQFSRWRNVIEQYTYYRYRVRYRIEVNGTQFHAGKLIASTRMGPTAKKDNTQLAVSHVILDAADNTVAELETDWGSCFDHLSTEQNFGPSTMNINVYNQLRTGVGASTEINYTIYAQLLDVQLSLPRPLQGSAQGLINITHVNNMGNAPVEIKGDAFDVHGLDMPSNVEDPTRMVRSTISNPWMVEGRPALDRMSMYPSGVSLANSYTFGSTTDEMDIDWLKKKWTRLERVKVSTGDTFGTILTKGAVAPLPKLAGPTNFELSNGTLAWLSGMFANWRGDLEFCVEVVSTNYHTGKLFFGVNYGVDTVVNFSSTGMDPTTFYGKVIEVNEKVKCHNITVPYSHWNSWLDTSPCGATWQGTVPVLNKDTMIPPGFAVNRFTAGEWFLTVLNPLVVPQGIDTVIEVNIMVRAGDNFELHRPGCSGYLGASIAQGDVIGNQKSTVSTVTPSQYIERPRSLRELLKRSIIADTRRLAIRKAIGTNGNFPGAAVGVLDLDTYMLFNPWWNIVGSYAGMFGDLRVKLVVDFSNSSPNLQKTLFVGVINRPECFPDGMKNNFPQVLFEQLTTFRVQTVSGQTQDGFLNAGVTLFGGSGFTDTTVLPITNGFETQHVINSVAPTLELEIPYYGLYKYKANPSTNQHQKGIKGWGQLYMYQPGCAQVADTDLAAHVTMYLSCGDSFQTGHFMGPVEQQVQAQSNGGNYYYLGNPAPVPTTARVNEGMQKEEWVKVT